MRRTYQQGSVYQKGRRKSDPWLAEVPAYVQFCLDIPGHQHPKRKRLALVICRSRTIAERTAAERLEVLGVNSTQHFIEATSSITFKKQREAWLGRCSGSLFPHCAQTVRFEWQSYHREPERRN